MRDFQGAEAGGNNKAGTVPEPGKQALMAVMIGAAALSVAMLLILLAAWQAPSSVVTGADPNGNTSAQADARSLKIDHYAARAKTGVLGSRVLVVEGYMTNAGSLTVEAADLRCHFTTNSGDQAHFDFPLVVDSQLDNLGDGPLTPMMGRNFSVRMGEFPDGITSEITRVEVINIRLKNG